MIDTANRMQCKEKPKDLRYIAELQPVPLASNP